MFDIFLIFAQNIDCGYTLESTRRGGSNEYPQFMFCNKNKKNKYTPAYPSFAVQKWGSMGYTLQGHVFLIISTPTICISDTHCTYRVEMMEQMKVSLKIKKQNTLTF